MNAIMTKNSDATILLSAKGVSKTYNSGGESFQAVSNIDLDIYEGEFTVIMGSSGSGKSTLLYMLSGLDAPSDGEIYFRNERIDCFSESRLSWFRATTIGYVYQAMHLIPDLTLYENVAFPGYVSGRSAKDVRIRGLELMKSMDIDKQKDRLPSQVSGGQQQRTAIARALINSPDVLFADEPTGALSVQQGTGILDIMSGLNRKGQTIVMVTHDLKAACRADRIVVVKDGTVDGILQLPKYETEDLRHREQIIYSYISGEE